MEYWEFLIQREGDRSWRSIKTGNLQLMEGQYRIVAHSNLAETKIQTRIAHQTLGSTVPQRRSRSIDQMTNAGGLLEILPFTHLKSGIWQFVCSGTTSTQTSWHHVLKLRVLTRIPTQSPPNFTNPTPTELLEIGAASSSSITNNQPLTHSSQVVPAQFAEIEESEDFVTPTEPIMPISVMGEPENWAERLNLLLERLEWESLQPQSQQPEIIETLLGKIKLQPIVDSPSQLIDLDRSTFSGLIPGHQLMISGACNLQLLTGHIVQTVKIEKLSICLRHPQTSEVVVSIEQSLPSNLHTFIFHGRLELPSESKITLLLGEVSLFDRHHIQLGSRGFTVTLNLNPLQESEPLSLPPLDRHTDIPEATREHLERLDRSTQESQPASATLGLRASIPQTARFAATAQTKPIQSDRYPTVPLAYKRESLFTHPDVLPVEPSTSSNFLHPAAVKTTIDPEIETGLNSVDIDLTGDLEIDFAHPTTATPPS
ncbi:hypothetical protein, partial [Chamaesiphon sp. OTE_75_metabat_556]|uniref:hypothetical protein n=1 Tax=Chamaesiphon sp. OTE_75_metabat_556 TaxID=2964692 RepID=UPI00286CA865